ncbi:PREDICTED: uncharacterized protein LOC108573952 [Habropoda laboriosa]|uniref:uncharacterized protein LOC108573952 n=1 Tax=Habropoda laboriosa TaxID=597456 RepID=UPI00083D3E3D|nr:PREDICTED: uncharacterized protein LOC108573952 [Habropoda laboriosa]
MALKKRTSRSKGEQLYILEVFVDRVNLNHDITNVSEEDLIVCVRFTDLPVYQINVPPNKEVDGQDDEQTENSTDSKFGKSCLFAKTPSCLIRAIRWSPLCLELYDKTSSCSDKNPGILGRTKITLPACMCKHVIKAQNQASTPCTVKDTFDLTNSDGKMTGNVTVILRLSCYGSSIVKNFSLQGKSFMLEDSPLRKFLCPHIPSDSTNNDRKDSKDEATSSKPLLKRPDSPPRISMEDPAFKTLTTAEKLNDPKYRELVYTAYPNERTCSCLPADRSKHPMECRSGCTRPCCVKLRNPNILSPREDKHAEDTLANTYCVNNVLSALNTLKEDSPCVKPARLRGGGDIEQIYLSSVSNSGYRWTDYDTGADYTWYGDKNNRERRLEGGGGGEEGMSSCSCSGSPVPVPHRKSGSREGDVIPIFDACTPRVTSTGAKPGCACPGKDSKSPRGGAKCMKSPCMGIDCLIRAFKDAQEFVDSIGKVPGLEGLGLMDPSESPYFGRDLDRDYVDVEAEEESKRRKPGSPRAPTCTAPCSMQIGKLDETRPPLSPYAPDLPRGVTVPPRLGIVREAIPVLPEAGSALVSTKHRKKEEKKDEKTDKKELDATSLAVTEAEMGPCGEPKCKSRRRKPPDSEAVHQTASQISSKPRAGVKKSATTKGRRKSPKTSRGGSSKRRGNLRGSPGYRSSNPRSQQRKTFDNKEKGKDFGPDGDRSPALQPEVPVSRRVMKYVYFVGDFYPGINYGHRECIDVNLRVPANMGWLWNTVNTAGNLKPRIGWKPGAIGRYLYEMLQDAKENSFAEEDERDYERGRGRDGDRGRAGKGTGARGGRTGVDRGGRVGGRGRMATERARSAPSRQKSPASRRTGRAMSYQGMQKQLKMEGEEEGVEAPPTLHIHRKDGTYYVTMYPIRQETSTDARLAEPMKPLQFKIVKNKDDASVASSSTASDMEIEFSPPAAVSRIRKKPDVIHVDTQVRQQEIIDAYKAEELKKKSRRGRRDKRLRKASKTSVRK